MPAPNGNQNAKGKHRPGAGGKPAPLPSKEYLAQEIAKLGATDEDLARCFAVTERTINAWKTENVDFASALKEGKLIADSLVEASLFHRATGYSHDAVKIFCDPKTGKKEIVEFIEHYPPDTTACIFWLKNRRPAEWRDKMEMSHQVEDIDGLVERVRSQMLADFPTADPALVAQTVQEEFERLEAKRIG